MASENPREMIEQALGGLRAETGLGEASPAWMVFRAQIFRAFMVVEERLGDCLRAQREVVREIEDLRRQAKRDAEAMKGIRGELAEANVKLANLGLGGR